MLHIVFLAETISVREEDETGVYSGSVAVFSVIWNAVLR